jgi:nucleotide-binding universal stress UspA family protein
MKTILLHTAADPDFEGRLQAALDLARAFAGHVTALAVTPYTDYTVTDPICGPFVIEAMLKAVTDRDRRLQAEVEARLEREGVPFDFVQAQGNVAEGLAEASLLADAVVLTRPAVAKNWSSGLDFAADVTIRSAAPVLMLPPAANPFDCTAPALVAWRARPEAAAALKAALPLLRLASAVTVLHVTERPDAIPLDTVGRYLSREGVSAELVERAPSPSIEAVIRDEAAARGAGYVVMGAYGHSRALEWAIGGVSRSLLLESPLPLLLAH